MTPSKSMLTGQRVILLLSDGVPRNPEQVAEALGLSVERAKDSLSTLSRRQMAKATRSYALTVNGNARAGQLVKIKKARQLAEQKALERKKAALEKEIARAAVPSQQWTGAASGPSQFAAPSSFWGGLAVI